MDNRSLDGRKGRQIEIINEDVIIRVYRDNKPIIRRRSQVSGKTLSPDKLNMLLIYIGRRKILVALCLAYNMCIIKYVFAWPDYCNFSEGIPNVSFTPTDELEPTIQ